MKYLKELQLLIDKYSQNIKLDEREEKVLVSLFSLGRDGDSVNAECIYSLTMMEYNDICEKCFEARTSSRQKLDLYKRNIREIISEITKHISESEIESLAFKEKKQVIIYARKGIERLKELV